MTNELKTNTPILKQVFGDNRIIGLAGEKNSGKTNNLIHLIQDLKAKLPKVKIFAYGMQPSVMKYLESIGVQEISGLKQLLGKRNCVLILDEFQRLKLNDRRYKDALADFVDFVYHNNVYTIFSSPNIREFNKMICTVIERWLLKTVNIDSTIGGSVLKKTIHDYRGRYKVLDSTSVPVDKLLLINEDREIIIHCPYVEQADNKLDNVDLFEQKNVKKLSGKMSEKMSEKSNGDE